MEVKYVYQPVIIETVEQAAALPDGTLAYVEFDSDILPQDQVGFRWSSLLIKYGDDHWEAPDEGGVWPTDKTMIGWTALVKVEVREETSVSAPTHRPLPFRDITFSIGGTNITDVHGQDITVEYTDWVASLPRKTRFSSEWA